MKKSLTIIATIAVLATGITAAAADMASFNVAQAFVPTCEQKLGWSQGLVTTLSYKVRHLECELGCSRIENDMDRLVCEKGCDELPPPPDYYW